MKLPSILRNKCPKCKQGEVFHNHNLFSFLRLGKMNERCPDCNKNFFPEIGFYWGAMFVSYGLATAEGLITILGCYLYGNELFDYTNLLVIFIVMVILFPVNFRLSRLIWLYIFG